MKQKKYSMILKVLVSSLLVLSLSGCWPCPEPPKPEIITITKTSYVTQPIPTINKPPVVMPYNTDYLNINKQDYFITPISDGNVMISNWENFKAWAYGNYNTLITLRDTNTTKPDVIIRTSNRTSKDKE